MLSLIISHPADAGQRLDRFIRKYLPNMPLGGIYKMLRTGKIKVNGKKKDQMYVLEIDDEISFWLTDEELEKWKFQKILDTGDAHSAIPLSDKKMVPLDVLFEDDYLMVINKPSGINVHPWDHKTTESSIIEQVQDYLKGRYDSLTFRPALVHRIDRETSGCLLIAKDKSVLEKLLLHLQAHEMEKVYHTIVKGIPLKKQDTIRARLLRIENAKNEAKVRVDDLWQSATTHFTLLQELHINQPFSLLECRIETGRTHQIRVHMAHIWHPVVWDRAYGDRSINSYISRELWISRQLLHARSLAFIHPKNNQKLIIEAPYPTDFAKILS